MPMREESGEVVGVIQYARSLKGVQQTISRLVLLPLALGGLGAALFGGLYMAGRAMRPARESFEKQRAFIADASHELKTPLTLIRADAEVVLYRGYLNQEDQNLVEHSLTETDRMGTILSDLLLVAGSTPTKPTWRQSPLISPRSSRRRQSASACGRPIRPAAQAVARASGSPSPESSRGPRTVISWPRAWRAEERPSASACLANETWLPDETIANESRGQSAGWALPSPRIRMIAVPERRA